MLELAEAVEGEDSTVNPAEEEGYGVLVVQAGLSPTEIATVTLCMDRGALRGCEGDRTVQGLS